MRLGKRIIQLLSLGSVLVLLAACGGGGGGGNTAVPQSPPPPSGSLDTSFGSGTGKVTTDLGSDFDFAHAVAVQAVDGKIVAAGYSINGTTGVDFVVARYSAVGTLDTSFQTTGIVTDLAGGEEVAYGVALQPVDGKIVTVGYSNASGTRDFALTRYNLNDGSLDNGFSGDGKIKTDLTGVDFAKALAIQSDGMIVTAGSTNSNGTYDFAVVRYNPANGTPDTGFSGNGVVKTDFSGGHDFAEAVAVDTSNRIVVAGVADGHFALARYGSTGSLDQNFGDPTGTGSATGKVTLQLGLASQINAIAIQPLDGKIVVAGHDEDAVNGKNILISRYHSDGTLDTSFGPFGFAVTDYGVGDDVANAVALQLDGKIVVTGYVTDGTAKKFVIVRYTADGDLDTGFGTNGIVLPGFGTGSEGYGIAIQPDGKIVAAGTAVTVNGNDFALVRVNP